MEISMPIQIIIFIVCTAYMVWFYRHISQNIEKGVYEDLADELFDAEVKRIFQSHENKEN